MREQVSRLLDRYLPVLMVAPALCTLVGLIIYPFVFNIDLSLHQVTQLNMRRGSWPFVGMTNFLKALTDSFSQAALFRTFLFAAATVFLQIGLGLVGALAFQVDFYTKNLLFTGVLLPMMITPVAVGLVWKMLLNAEWGIVNYVIALVGIPPQQWLSDPYLAFVSIVGIQVWWGISFVILVLLGGLHALPQEPFEAARIDGASAWQAFRYITLPLLWPVVAVAATIRIIDAFREFDIIYTVTGGGPAGATRVFALELFYTAFERGDLGLSAAQALVLLLLTLVFTAGLVRTLARPETNV
jgi:multiple sugar transport system permease protein